MNEADKKALQRELEAMQRLDHPLIIKCVEYFVQDDVFYVMTEYAKGGSFNTILENL